MPENKTVKNRVLCLAMCVFTIFCLNTVCPAGEKKSEEEMSDSERLHRALQKSLKNGELSRRQSQKTKTGSDSEGPKYTPDKADKIINTWLEKNLTNAQMVAQTKQIEDREEMFIVLKRLSDMGNYKAMARLGANIIDAHENDPHHNPYEGFRLLVTAARAGDAWAQWHLDYALMRDPYFTSAFKARRKEAYRWCYASAEQGYAHAQQEIGRMLVSGAGLNKLNQSLPIQEDYIESYKWLTLAINRYKAGLKKASIMRAIALNSRDAVADEISPKEIKEALRRAEKWEKSHSGVYKKHPFNELD